MSLVYRTVLGIDVGRTGALASISQQTGLVRVHDMPAEDGRGINLYDLRLILQEYTASTTLIGLEWNNSRPGEVPDYAFRFGLQTGELHGLAFGLGFKVQKIRPQAWCSYFGLPGKQDSSAMPLRVAVLEKAYPAFSHLLYGPRSGILSGITDALLIAHYLRLSQTTFGLKGGRRPAIQRGEL